MKKQKIYCFLAGAVLMTSLAACGGGAKESSASGTSGKTEAESGKEESSGKAEASDSADSGSIRMSWWGGDSRHEATLKALDAYMAENPGVKIESEYGAWSGWTDKIATQLAGTSAPDVLQINWNWIYQFSSDGKGFYDLKQSKDDFDFSQYDENLLEQMTIDGKLQAIPIATTGKAFFWNQQTWEKAGLSVPKSFSELLAAGPIFKEKLGDDYYPMAAGEYDLMMLLTYYMQESYDKPWVENGAISYTKDELADGFDFLKKLEENHVIPSQEKMKGDGADSIDKNPNFIDGHYAGLYEWDSAVSKMQGALADGQTLVLGEYPADYGKPSTIYKISMGFALSKDTKNPKADLKLLDYLLNGEGVKTLGLERGIPASKAAQKTLSEEGKLEGLVYEANKAASENYRFTLSPYYEDSKLKDPSEGAYYEIMDNMSYDHEDSKELAQQMIDAVNELESSKA